MAPRTRRNAATRPTNLAVDVGRVVRENIDLKAENDRLKAELAGIHAALVQASRGSRRAKAATTSQSTAAPRQRRGPITDPVQLERRKAALEKARAARSAKLRAARGESNGVAGEREAVAAEA